MKIVLMSGIPGSGKSSYVERMQKEDYDLRFCICSADHFFQKNLHGRFDPDVEYKFDPARLAEAHAECLKKFVDEIVPGSRNSSWSDVIVVDNTNTTTLELSPYVALGMAYNIPVEIVTIRCDPHLGAERNTHGVSYLSCSRMAANINNRAIPVFWKVKLTNLPLED